ncbi:hypothetical protein JY96_13410 [Aquabacterium sp. NJ1]|uniref:hypothetical protein n=1 Tax=Aquabacterium sp. NJ1 TaxID=1538295 RepID=UPI00052BD56E|nr:hypothetical protein [Aquabacterium sp. NJ1]KGM40705.1 hypothetical protein JY96_13410 [Aquabacterium sp. NJ1]
MTTYRSQVRSHLFAFTLVLLAGSGEALAAGDPVNGKQLYNDEARTGGASCSGCHNVDPTRNISNVLTGSGQPDVIQHAVDNNTGDMGQLAGIFSASEYADIAAYLSAMSAANTPSLSFGATLNGNDARSVTLSNNGGLYFSLGSATLEGSGAASFTIDSSACSGLVIGGPQTKATALAVSECQIQVRYEATSASQQDAVLVIQGDAINARGGALQAASPALRIPLIGSLSAVSLSPNALKFNNVEAGHSYAGSSTLLNAGGVAVTVGDISLNDASDHVRLASGPGYCNKGDVLEAGQQCLLAVMVSGPASASIQVQSSAGAQVLAVEADEASVAAASTLSTPQASNDGAGGCAIVGPSADFDPMLLFMSVVALVVSCGRSRRP